MTTNGQLSREDIITYYASILTDPELANQISGSLHIVRNYLFDQSTGFLNSLKPLIDQHTDDSRSVLLHLIEQGDQEENINEVLKTQQTLPGFSYADTALLLQSLKAYYFDDMIDSPEAIRSNPQRLIALHRVVHTLRALHPITYLDIPRGHPLECAGRFIGQRAVFRIRSHELLNITLRHADKVDLITSTIRTHRSRCVPVLKSVLNGGSVPLSNGSL